MRFEVAGPLSQIELCHCAKCQKAYGGACAATLYARAGDFRWTSGASRVATFDAPLEREPPAYRHCFCRRCGAPLPLCWDGLPWVELPTGCLDDPVAARPAYQQFCSQRAGWLELGAGLAQFEGAAPLAEKVIQSLAPAQRPPKASW